MDARQRRIGLWASNIDFGSDDPVVAEIAASAGVAGDIAFLNSAVGYDVAVTYNFYPRKHVPAAAGIEHAAPASVLERPAAVDGVADLLPDASIPVNPDAVTGDYEFLELTGELTRASILGTWALSAAYTPDAPGGPGQAVAVGVGLTTPITESFSASGAVQKSWTSASIGADYIDWNLGLTYMFGVADVDVRYHQAEDKACVGDCPARFVVSLVKEF